MTLTSGISTLVSDRFVGSMALALFVSLFLVLTSGIAHAADDIILRTSVTPSEAWVGQRTLLHIEVLGADGWAQIPKLPEPDLSGAYVMRTESQGVRLRAAVRDLVDRVLRNRAVRFAEHFVQESPTWH